MATLDTIEQETKNRVLKSSIKLDSTLASIKSDTSGEKVFKLENVKKGSVSRLLGSRTAPRPKISQKRVNEVVRSHLQETTGTQPSEEAINIQTSGLSDLERETLVRKLTDPNRKLQVALVRSLEDIAEAQDENVEQQLLRSEALQRALQTSLGGIDATLRRNQRNINRLLAEESGTESSESVVIPTFTPLSGGVGASQGVTVEAPFSESVVTGEPIFGSTGPIGVDDWEEHPTFESSFSTSVSEPVEQPIPPKPSTTAVENTGQTSTLNPTFKSVVSSFIPKFKSAKGKESISGQGIQVIVGSGRKSLISPAHPDYKKRLTVLAGEIEAGNNSKNVLNEIADLISALMQKGEMTRDEGTRILNKIF